MTEPGLHLPVIPIGRVHDRPVDWCVGDRLGDLYIFVVGAFSIHHFSVSLAIHRDVTRLVDPRAM